MKWSVTDVTRHFFGAIMLNISYCVLSYNAAVRAGFPR